MKTNNLLLIFISVFLALSGIYILQTGVQATPLGTTYTVCASGCDFSNIQAAIDGATEGDLISLAGEMFTEHFTVDKSLTIRGVSSNTTILQAGTSYGTATNRVMTVTEGSTVTLQNVTVRFGNAPDIGFNGNSGGGIFNDGYLTIEDSRIISNTAFYHGGGVMSYEQGSLTITNCLIAYNQAESGGGIYSESGSVLVVANSRVIDNQVTEEGGGIDNYDYSTLHLSNTTISGNSAFYGGGIYQDIESTLTILDSTLTDNVADAAGGGIYSNYKSQANITNTVFISNTANETGGGAHSGNSSLLTLDSVDMRGNYAANQGGGIFSNDASTLTIRGCDITANSVLTSSGYGGGVYVHNQGLFTASDSTFSGNHAFYGGGVYVEQDVQSSLIRCKVTNNVAQSDGGGIYNNNNNANLWLSQSTVSDNHAVYGGGIGNDYYAGLTVTQSTIANNTATYRGGGIYHSYYSTMTIENSTLSGNTAPTGGGVQIGSSLVTLTHATVVSNTASSTNGGAGIHAIGTSSIYLQGTIIANNTKGDCDYETSTSHVTDLGYNIVRDGSCITDSTSLSANPLIGPLMNNGGRTFTHALLEGSPAIDAIPLSACIAMQDQRGFSRPQKDKCDIGAFELGDFILYLPLVVRSEP